MTDVNTKKESLAKDIATLEEALKKKRREAEKLEAVQTSLLNQEPVPGAVILFSRSLAGSTKKYTFVAFRAWDGENSWVITGKDNTVQLAGLKNSGNSWSAILVAVGQSKIKVATSWARLGDDSYEYFLGAHTGRVYRGHESDPRLEAYIPTRQGWVYPAIPVTSTVARKNPSRYIPVSEEEAFTRI